MKDKSKEYEEKVDLLIQKIQEEKNKVKRLYYIIKCKKLIILIKKERDLKQLRKDLKTQKENNINSAKKQRINIRTNIIRINEKIKEKELELSKNRSI